MVSVIFSILDQQKYVETFVTLLMDSVYVYFTSTLLCILLAIVYIYKKENILRIVVKDTGSGMRIDDIPKATLLSGYSSKISLGHGFSLMLKLMDQIKLATSSEGTTIVMEIGLTYQNKSYPSSINNNTLQVL
ncbi:hypothetical protein KDJ21_003835 [Metabacillus litoralis]|uniref:ATP-binding protein n=1 Tax=Metabacillus litoralis TaxID=152268 RepID=UPI001B9C9E83|nr:hypothetical protein [Metabacillus litoralis]UHA60845.1 hypothetical protein KDJ21_003835 [Metabacillus litoralis]